MVLSGFMKPLSMILGYVYVPVVLNYLGTEKYSVWSTLLTILSWISYFDIGIGNGLRNKLTEAIAKHRMDESKKLVSSAYAFVAVIVVIVATVFCFVAMLVDWERVFGVQGLTENLALVVCISAIFVSLNFVLSLCKNVLYACQQAATVSYMELTIQILNLTAVLIATRLLPSNLFMMAFIYGCSMTITYLVFNVVIFTKHHEFLPDLKSVDLASGKNLTNLGLQFFIIQIAALILFTTDSLIISYLFGAADVTPYSAVNKLFNAISSSYVAFLAPIWSATTKAKAEQKWDYLKRIVTRLRIFMVPFFVGIVVLIVVFKPLSTWWLRRELNYEPGLIVLGGVYCALTIWCNAHATISNGLQMMKVSLGVAIVQAIINIPLSLLFAKGFGMNSAGVLLGTVSAMGIAAIILPIAIESFFRRNIKGEKF